MFARGSDLAAIAIVFLTPPPPFQGTFPRGGGFSHKSRFSLTAAARRALNHTPAPRHPAPPSPPRLASPSRRPRGGVRG